MTIGRIDHIDPIPPGKKPGRSDRVKESASSDSIDVSRAALEKAELFRVMELVSAAPDVRADRVAELRQKINDPDYINERIINATADRIMDAFGL
jgi:negative regulator of flagellin synthesis FlgM